MAGRSFVRQTNTPTSRISAGQINELQIALEEDDTRIDAKADQAPVSAHVTDTQNPHAVTKGQVGLANVDNTSDANKPVSTATQAALDTKADEAATQAALDTKAEPADIETAVEAITATATFVLDGQGEDVEAGETATTPPLTFDGTITGWRILGAAAGDFAASVRKSSYATYPTFTLISGSAGPAMTGTVKAENLALSGWTTGVSPGDVLQLLVTSATVTHVTVQLIIQRSV